MTDMGLRDRPTLETSTSHLGLIDVLTALRSLAEEMRADRREVQQHALEYAIELLKQSNLLDWEALVDGDLRRIESFNRAFKTIKVASRD